MAREYNVQGTKSYLIAAVILLIASLWFIWDGWFPRASVLANHPSMDDSFYLFNKSMGVLLGIGSVVCGYIHMVVK